MKSDEEGSAELNTHTCQLRRNEFLQPHLMIAALQIRCFPDFHQMFS